MKILVLGGNGFIGSHLVDNLLFHNHDVRVYDRSEEVFRNRLEGVEYRLAEFNNRDALGDSLKEIDVVVHLISTTSPSTSNIDPKYDIESNLIETIYLLEQCVLKNIRKIIFVSSGGTVYGEPASLPVSELAQLNPICSYGISKLAIEKYLFMFKKLYGLDYVILRPSNPYGERQSPYGNQGIIPIYLGKIYNGKPLEIWGNGDASRDYIYIGDLIDALYLVIAKNTNSVVYNIGIGEGHTIDKLVEIMGKVTGQEVKKIKMDARPTDVKEITLDINLAARELNLSPKVNLEEGITATWAFICELEQKSK